MKSFEEFHTSQKRQRAWDEADQKEKTKTLQLKKEDLKNDEYNSGGDTNANFKANSNNKSISRHTIGQTLEMHESQLFMVALIYINLVTCTITYIFENDVGTLTSTARVEKLFDPDSAILQILSSITNFTTVCFLLEIGGLVYSFGIMTFFSHFGYSMDAFIIGSILYDNIYDSDFGFGSYIPIQFLTYLRCWRVIRLISTMVSKVENSHEETKVKLARVEKQVMKQEMDCRQLQISNLDEMELRKQVEKLLTVYKDEVETLKEALKIAALDVAIATKEVMKGDGERAGVGHEERIVKEDDSSDHFKDEDDNFVDSNGDTFFDGNEDEKINGLNTDSKKIVVNNDGTFEVK
jgi:hypothetical protein